MEMVKTENRLHELENDLSDYKSKNPNFTTDDIKKLITSRNIVLWMDEDLNVLKETLGKDVFSTENIFEVKKSSLDILKSKIEALSSDEEKQSLLKELKKLTKMPFLKLINEYDKYIYRLADKMKKLVNPIKIEGGLELVDYQEISEFARSLVHIVRNCIEHGIELPDDRIAKNKSEYGNISFKIWEEKNELYVLIEDDGNGIDPEIIKQKALSKGFVSNDELIKMSKEEIINLIFKPEISTHKEISKFSGRGIGLFSVFQEVEKLGGKIIVETSLGVGTAFKFIIPID
jgi:two-component system chemotaxis sensor kinase CheA